MSAMRGPHGAPGARGAYQPAAVALACMALLRSRVLLGALLLSRAQPGLVQQSVARARLSRPEGEVQ